MAWMFPVGGTGDEVVTPLTTVLFVSIESILVFKVSAVPTKFPLSNFWLLIIFWAIETGLSTSLVLSRFTSLFISVSSTRDFPTTLSTFKFKPSFTAFTVV